MPDEEQGDDGHKVDSINKDQYGEIELQESLENSPIRTKRSIELDEPSAQKDQADDGNPPESENLEVQRR